MILDYFVIAYYLNSIYLYTVERWIQDKYEECELLCITTICNLLYLGKLNKSFISHSNNNLFNIFGQLGNIVVLSYDTTLNIQQICF